MSREKIRSFKRIIRNGIHHENGPLKNESQHCALALLARSIEFGHSRLAVIRLCTAIELGAQIPEKHWHYCSQVAKNSADEKLKNLYQLALNKTVNSKPVEQVVHTT